MNWADEAWWLVIPAAVVVFMGYRSRGWRVLLVVIVGIGLFVVPPLLRFIDTESARGSASGETSVIQNYDARFMVAADGDLTLVETLDVKFNEVRRGIFRFFDEADAQDDSVDHPVDIMSVQRCAVRQGEVGRCAAEPYVEYYEGQYKVAKIGLAEVTYPPGTVNRYIITSRQSDALTSLPASDDVQWYWDVVGAGWQMPMRQVRIRADLPTPPDQVRCITDSGACTVDGAGKDTTYVTELRQLPALTPVTWQALFPPAGLSAMELDTAVPWWRTYVAAIVGVLAGLVLVALIRMLHDPKPSRTPVFAVPGNDILPSVWTWKERPPKDSFSALLMQLNHLGVVRLSVDPQATTRHDPGWVEVTRTSNPVPSDVSGAEDVLDVLELDRPGDTELIRKDSVSLGQRLQGMQARLDRLSASEARAQGWYVASLPGKLVNLIAALLPAVAGVVLVWTRSPFFASMFLIPGIAGLWSGPEIATRLSSAGRQMRDQVSGLRTALSTPASVERYDYALKARYFEQYLPWAMALGCAQKWAQICKPPPGVEDDPSSPYYSSYSTWHASSAVSSAVSSVSAGAVAAYAASQSSSSGGGSGGGFSSGGGSGGGGGGSW